MTALEGAVFNGSSTNKKLSKLTSKLHSPSGISNPSDASLLLKATPTLAPYLTIKNGSIFTRSVDEDAPKLSPFELKSLLLGMLTPHSTAPIHTPLLTLLRTKTATNNALLSPKYVCVSNLGFLTNATLVMHTPEADDEVIEAPSIEAPSIEAPSIEAPSIEAPNLSVVAFSCKLASVSELNVTEADGRNWTGNKKNQQKKPPLSIANNPPKKRRSRQDDDPSDTEFCEGESDADDNKHKAKKQAVEVAPAASVEGEPTPVSAAPATASAALAPASTPPPPASTNPSVHPLLLPYASSLATLTSAGFPSSSVPRTHPPADSIKIPEIMYPQPMPSEGQWFQTTTEPFQTTTTPPQSPPSVYILDCEMVKSGATTLLGRLSLLEIISLKPYTTATVLDTFVECDSVTEYLTQWSGLTRKNTTPSPDSPSLNNAGQLLMRYNAVRRTLLSLLTPATILIGHGLHNDLITLKLIHETVIDTAVLYRDLNGRVHGLKYLAKGVLNKWVQEGEHCSKEDCYVTGELVSRFHEEDGITVSEGKVQMGDVSPLLSVIDSLGIKGSALVGTSKNFLAIPSTWDVSRTSLPKPKPTTSGATTTSFNYAETSSSDLSPFFPPTPTSVTIILSNPHLHSLRVIESNKRAAMSGRGVSVWNEEKEGKRVEAINLSKRWQVQIVTQCVVKEEKAVKEEEAVKEEAVKEEAVKEEAVKEEAVKEEAVKEEAVKEEVKEANEAA